MPLPNAPRDFMLDEDNDLVITTDVVFTYGIDAIVQDCRIALQMFRGEWFLDLDAGIPFWDAILGAKPEIAVSIARDEFREALLAVEGVVDVIQLDVVFVRESRTLTVKWRVKTELGDTPIDTVVIDPLGEDA